MFQRIIDDFKETTGAALRLTSLAAAAAVALFITISFFCAAAFVVVLDTYGLVQACLAGAAVFFVVTLIAAGCYMGAKARSRPRAPGGGEIGHAYRARRSHGGRGGLQVIRAIGVKRLIPLLAVGGLALGFLASRQNVGDQTPAE